MSTVTIQILSPRRTGPTLVNDARWLDARFVVSAAAMSAIGLANICRFPYLVSRHGGGAFVLAYLVALVVLALPLLMAELMVGRHGRVTPAECYDYVAREEGHTVRWGFTGVLAGMAGFVILAGYAGAAGSSAVLLTNGTQNAGVGIALGWQGVFLGLTGLVASRGLRSGVRLLQVRLLPITLLFATALLIHCALRRHELGRAFVVAFQPDFARFSWWGALDAARLALLTVGVGLGVAVSYGAVIGEKTSIFRTSLIAVAVAALLVLLGTVVTVATARSAPLGGFLLLGGLGGAVALLHPIVEQFNRMTGQPRLRSALGLGAIAWGLAALLEVGTSSVTERIALLGPNLLLPAAALSGAIVTGWVMSRRSSRLALGLHPARLFIIWRAAIRYLAPTLLGIVLLLGVIELLS